MPENSDYQPAEGPDNIEKGNQALFDGIASKYAQKDYTNAVSLSLCKYY